MIAKFIRFSRHQGRRAFSLVEVVVAVGIFALAIVAVIGLLAPLGSSVADVRDGDDASRVATTIQAGLQDEVNRLKQANSTNYWSDFASYLQDPDNLPANPFVLYASRDGSKVGPELIGAAINPIWDTNNDGELRPEEQAAKFFEITLTRNKTLSDPDDDASAGYLAFNITLRWPGYIQTGTGASDFIKVRDNANAKAQQSVLILPAAVVR